MICFGAYLNDYLKFEKISQSDFAFRLGITQKHLNEIINGKTNISNDLMFLIADFTGIDINFISEIERKRNLEIELEKNIGTNEEIKAYLKLFKPKEIKKRNWIKFKDETNLIQTAYDILKYLRYPSFEILKKSKEKILFKENVNKVELLSLWLARCDYLAEDQDVMEYDKENLNKIIDEVNNSCYVNNNFDVKVITNILNMYGIYFVTEDALPSTSVRGAFKIFKGKPAIYLTKHFKRLDGVIYSLYHELGHVKSDYNQGKSKVIIDGNEVQEARADEFAKNAMISNKDYELLLKTPITQNNLSRISAEKKIPLCYIVSRLAKENIIEYNEKLYLENIIKIV